MQAISGTRRAMKEMADGTIRVQVDIDPACRSAFLSMFGNIDMPVALAPLVSHFEQAKPVVAQNEPEARNKGGELARLAGRFCQNEVFRRWCDAVDAEEAAGWIREQCDVISRGALDHDAAAADKFHKLVRLPYMAWLDDHRNGVEEQG